MRTKLYYSKATYGTHNDPTCYKMSLSVSSSEVTVSVKYEGVKENDATVTGGEVSIPIYVAKKLASAILWLNEQDSTGIEKLSFEFNEDDIKNKCRPGISLFELDHHLMMNHLIVREDQMIDILSEKPSSYPYDLQVPLPRAKQVVERVTKESKAKKKLK